MHKLNDCWSCQSQIPDKRLKLKQRLVWSYVDKLPCNCNLKHTPSQIELIKSVSYRHQNTQHMSQVSLNNWRKMRPDDRDRDSISWGLVFSIRNNESETHHSIVVCLRNNWIVERPDTKFTKIDFGIFQRLVLNKTSMKHSTLHTFSSFIAVADIKLYASSIL